ncbi:ATP-binding cassette domain-containing protein [Sphingomonas sp.]|jgi:molybdate transport system ATP-binding protein|uniref:ATP-binding cassette domain-containing protein n=1 Tax=Sphingomonas sp. TaxID=28214 RepID=UPI002D7FC8EB|nr:ATP-binding cassette domain-containing protein [Sphingomonas sp.]HEU0044953.1 ATP-binding cassette domain-containing protein [Sphingomonas sp.]
MSFDVDIRLRRGERVIACAFAGRGATVLVGPSGVGKTSVLHALAGLLTPDCGHVRIAGETLFDAAAGVDVSVARRRAGYVFQDTRLFPHLSVRRNLLYAAATDEMLAETVAMLDIGDLLSRRPASLSGGEARRVAIGRALLMQPRFLLLDEPTVSLDADRREEVLRAVERVRDAATVPVLMVTHDAREAARIGRVVELRNGAA